MDWEGCIEVGFVWDVCCNRGVLMETAGPFKQAAVKCYRIFIVIEKRCAIIGKETPSD
jgi:hypothetical protein